MASLRYSTSSDLSKLLLVAKVTRLRSIVSHVYTWQLQPQKDMMDEAVMLSMRSLYRTHIPFLSKASVCANNDAQHAAWHFSVMSSYNTIAFCVYTHAVKTKGHLSVNFNIWALQFGFYHAPWLFKVLYNDSFFTRYKDNCVRSLQVYCSLIAILTFYILRIKKKKKDHSGALGCFLNG